MKTILILTRQNRLHDLGCELHGHLWTFQPADIGARLSTSSAIYTANHRQLFAAPDSWPEVTWLQEFLSGVEGEIQVVRHSNFPIADHWNMATPLLTGQANRISFGFVGRHETDRDTADCKPYCMLADLMLAVLSNNITSIAAWPFDTLWDHLQAHFPIEDLLADKLDYLHGLLSGQRIAAGPALKKAISDADLVQLISGLPTGPCPKEHYTAFETIRDKILDLQLPAPQTR